MTKPTDIGDRIDYPEVVVSDTASAKCYRMLTVFQIHRAVLEGFDGDARVFRRRNTPDADDPDVPPAPGDGETEYHVRTGKYSIVVKPEFNHLGDPVLLVVTQMHAHGNYRNEALYERVDRVEAPK